MYLMLIIVMLFSSLARGVTPSSALDRSQRNTRRRQDMARVLSAFNDYQTNNAGKLPETETELNKFVEMYMGASGQNHDDTVCANNSFCDPDGDPYTINSPIKLTEDLPNALGGASFKTDNHEIHYFTSAECTGEEGSLKYISGARNVAIMYVLEGGAIYCGDNQ